MACIQLQVELPCFLLSALLLFSIIVLAVSLMFFLVLVVRRLTKPPISSDHKLSASALARPPGWQESSLRFSSQATLRSSKGVKLLEKDFSTDEEAAEVSSA